MNNFEFLQLNVLLNSIVNEIPAIIAFFTVLVVYQLFKSLILVKLSKDTDSRVVSFISDQVASFSWITAIATALFVAIQFSPSTVLEFKSLAYILFLAVWVYEFVQLVNSFISFLFEKSRARIIGSTSISMYRIMERGIKGLVWVIAGLVILSNMGVDITGIIAGLGIGGLAIALALQSLLGDFISTIAILMDKPFSTGDFISVSGDYLGTVDSIGMRSTRVRSINGEMIVHPNSELVNATIRNFGNLERRRSFFKLGVIYETNRDLVKDIPVFIHDIFMANKRVEKEEFRANLIEFGDSALVFEVQFFAATENYAEFLEIQEEVLFAIMDKFAEEKIEFAYPTQRVYQTNLKS